MSRRRKQPVSDVISAKSLRWMELVILLLERREPATREDIFARVAAYGLERRMAASDRIGVPRTAPESARRKFERDKVELRSRGLAIETVRIMGGGNMGGQVGYVLRPASDRPRSVVVLQSGASSDPEAPDTWQITQEELVLLDGCLAGLVAMARHPLQTAAVSAQRAINAEPVDSALRGPSPIRLMPQEQLAVQVALALDPRGGRLGERLAIRVPAA